MLISRFLFKLRAINHSMSIYAQFSERSHSSEKHIQNKIYNAKTFSDFYYIFENSREDFNVELICSVSKHLNTLIAGKQRVNFTEAGSLLKCFESVDINTLTNKSVISILSILRHFRLKGFHSTFMNSFKSSLVTKYIKEIRDKKPEELELPELINCYYEVAYYKNSYDCKVVADKISTILDEGLLQDKVALVPTQISFLLYCLSIRSDLTFGEVKIRSILLKKIQQQFSVFKLHELIKFAVSLNKMHFFDIGWEDHNIVKQITDNIYENITELEEKNIYELIKGEYNSKFVGFLRIYEEINKNIFDEIDAKGQTELNPDSIFKALGFLADKISLQRMAKADQQKFFVFLQNYAEYCNDNDKRKKMFVHSVYSLVKANYFIGEQKNRLIKIITDFDITLNLNILFEFATKGYDMRNFQNQILQFKPHNILSEEILIKVGFVASKLKSEKNNEIDALLQEIEEKVAQFIETPAKFMEFIKRIYRLQDSSLVEFHSVFGHIFNRLPNPLEEENPDFKYRSAYLQYMQQSNRSKQYTAFLLKYDSVITLDDFTRLLSQHLYNHSQKELQYKRPLIHQIYKRINDILDSKNKKAIEVVIDFVGKYNRFVVGSVLDHHSEMVIFKILQTLTSRIELLDQLGISGSFSLSLEKYLIRSNRRYNVEQNYRNLIKYLLPFIQKFVKIRRGIASNIIEESLRLNLLTAKAIEHVNIESLKLGHFPKSRSLYLKDNTFVPKIDRISIGSLTVIFSNPNAQRLLVENEAKIMELVKTVHTKQLSTYLTVYNHHKTPSSKKILSEILNNFIQKLKSFDKVDITGVLHNALEKNYYHFSQYKKLSERLVEEHRKKIGFFTIESHIELIKFIISQPGMNPREYYSELADFAKRRDDVSEYSYDQLLIHLASTNHLFQEHQIKKIQSISKRGIHSGLYFFLMLQKQFEPAARSQFVKKFVEKYNQLRENKQQTLNLNKIYYQYIKAQYPEETANFDLDEKQLYFERLTMKPKDLQLVNLIVKISGESYEELTEFGTENFLFQIKDCVFSFLASKHVGSYYEHDFLKRAVKAVKGQNINCICIYLSNLNHSIIEYIHKQCPTLFNQAEYDKTVLELKQLQISHKNKKKEEKVAKA